MTAQRNNAAPRKLARWVLSAMLRHVPEARHAWFEAMLGELEFVEGYWAALFWALGCTSVIFREWLQAGAVWLARCVASFFGIQTKKERKVNDAGKKTLGVLGGIGIALALGVGAFFVSPAIATMLQSVGVPRTTRTHLLTILLPTELIVVGAAI